MAKESKCRNCGGTGRRGIPNTYYGDSECTVCRGFGKVARITPKLTVLRNK